MGFYIIRQIAALSLFTLSSCAVSQSSHSSNNVKIDNIHNVCTLLFNGKRFESNLIPPCTIAVYKNKKQFANVKGEKVYVLVGKPATAEFLSHWNVSGKDKCSDQAQGFTIANKEIVFLSRVLKQTLICPNKYLDEKLIYTLAR